MKAGSCERTHPGHVSDKDSFKISTKQEKWHNGNGPMRKPATIKSQ